MTTHLPPNHTVACPLCGARVSLHPHPEQLLQRACGHWLDRNPATGCVSATGSRAATALRLARLADGQLAAERVQLRAAIERAKRIYRPAQLAGGE